MNKKRLNYNSQNYLVLKKIIKNKLAVFSLLFLFFILNISIFAPYITYYERDTLNLEKINSPPSAKHWLGTDDLGRDVYTRLIYGSRASLSVGILSTIISLIIGLLLGCLSGFFGGKTDRIIMTIVDVFMCFPFFIIAIVLAAVLGPEIRNVILILGFLGWMGICRIIRSEVLVLKEKEFVILAKIIGLNDIKIIFRHLIPNLIAPLIVFATLSVAGGILSEAGLSFLGLGVSQPIPSWGNMLQSAQNYRTLINFRWQWIPPGLIIFFTVMSINILGDALRDAFDPKI